MVLGGLVILTDDYSMSILSYFKRCLKGSSSEDKLQLSDPHGLLSARVPSSAIEAANKHVSEVLTAPASRGPYFKLTLAERFQVGKRAVELWHQLSIPKRIIPICC